jgi:hypothetical protein
MGAGSVSTEGWRFGGATPRAKVRTLATTAAPMARRRRVEEGD